MFDLAIDPTTSVSAVFVLALFWIFLSVGVNAFKFWWTNMRRKTIESRGLHRDRQINVELKTDGAKFDADQIRQMIRKELDEEFYEKLESIHKIISGLELQMAKNLATKEEMQDIRALLQLTREKMIELEARHPSKSRSS